MRAFPTEGAAKLPIGQRQRGKNKEGWLTRNDGVCVRYATPAVLGDGAASRRQYRNPVGISETDDPAKAAYIEAQMAKRLA